MATSLGLIEGFDVYNNLLSEYRNLTGTAWDTANWSAGQLGRLNPGVGFSVLGPNNISNTLVINANRTFPLTAVTDTYFLMAGLKPNLASAQRRFRFLDSADVAHVDIELAADGSFVAKNGDGTSLGASAAGLVTDALWGTLELKVVVSDASGVVQLKWNGVQILNLTLADTRNAGTAEVAKIEFSPDGLLDDVVGFIGAAADGFPGPRKVVVQRADADVLADFVRNAGAANFENVDEVGDNDGDTTYNESGTPGDIDKYSMTPVTATGAIDGVRLVAVARKTDVGIRNFKFVWNDGVNPDVKSASELLLNTSYLPFEEGIATKPAGGIWDVATVDASGFGVELTT